MRTRSTRAFFLAAAMACTFAGCGEEAKGPPTGPNETEPPPGLNPEPLEDVCDPPPPSVAGLGPMTWGVPEKVPVPFDAVAEPSLAAGEGVVYLAFEVRGPNPGGLLPMAPTDIYVMRREGDGWSEPVNISNTPTPSSRARLSIDAAGVVHALWGEHIAADGRHQDLIHPTSVFHATATGGEWSSPDTVWYATAQLMFLEMPKRLVPDAGGRTHVMITPGVDEANANVPELRKFVHLVWAGGAWSSPRRVYFGHQPDVVVDDAGDLLAVYVEGDPRGGETNYDVNSVFFIRSDDGGVTWSRPQRIVRGGRRAAYDPWIVIGGDGRIHAIWTRDAEDPGVWPPETIEHSHSTDGVCWSDPVEVAASLSGFPILASVVPDDGGGLHLIFHHEQGGAGGRPSRAMYVYRDGFAWGDPVPLFGAEEVGFTIGVARDPRGTLHVALAGEVGGEFAIYYATGRSAGTH